MNSRPYFDKLLINLIVLAEVIGLTLSASDSFGASTASDDAYCPLHVACFSACRAMLFRMSCHVVNLLLTVSCYFLVGIYIRP